MSEEAARSVTTREKELHPEYREICQILMDYCNSRGDHRVIFLVDEIGQYIAIIQILCSIFRPLRKTLEECLTVKLDSCYFTGSYRFNYKT
jgi:hypothetical protein